MKVIAYQKFTVEELWAMLIAVADHDSMHARRIRSELRFRKDYPELFKGGYRHHGS
jgi:hypothetical protein